MQLLEEVTFNTDESVELVVKELRVSKLNQLLTNAFINNIQNSLANALSILSYYTVYIYAVTCS